MYMNKFDEPVITTLHTHMLEKGFSYIMPSTNFNFWAAKAAKLVAPLADCWYYNGHYRYNPNTQRLTVCFSRRW